MDFYCPEQNCSSDGVSPFVLKLPDEACMDEQNIATVFCPRCGQSLLRKEAESGTEEN